VNRKNTEIYGHSLWKTPKSLWKNLGKIWGKLKKNSKKLWKSFYSFVTPLIACGKPPHFHKFSTRGNGFNIAQGKGFAIFFHIFHSPYYYYKSIYID